MSGQQPSLEEFKVEEFNLRGKENADASIHSPENDRSTAGGPSSEAFAPKALDTATVDRVLEMAWEDRTTFEAIELQFGLKEQEVIEVMRRYMKRSSFKMWRKRVTARKTKHAKKRTFDSGRFKSSNQKNY